MAKLWAAYSNALVERPILSNTLTAGVIGVVGDYVAQSIESGEVLRDVDSVRRHEPSVFRSFGFVLTRLPYYMLQSTSVCVGSCDGRCPHVLVVPILGSPVAEPPYSPEGCHESGN
jgi:hypothetical protein